MEHIVESTAVLTEVAKQTFRHFRRKRTASVMGLYGELGSGKTALVKELAALIGVTETIQSPTFVIMKAYDVPHAVYKRLIHVDAYRLASGEELLALGFRDVLRDRKNLILVEWADRVSDALPKNHLKIFFEFVDDYTRKVTLIDGDQKRRS